MDILYVGSGKSALGLPQHLEPRTVTCAVNNAWSLFPSGDLQYWIHPGDFPHDRRPPSGYRTKRISHEDYSKAAPLSCAIAGTDNPFQQHWIGYTIFFQGLHWIMHFLKPKRVFTLGFDHDYNPEKVLRWEEKGRPAPNNRYGEARPRDVLGWADKFFEGLEPDSFYGHGTPDPLRLGEAELKVFFQRAKDTADRLGIKLFNLSKVERGLNTFQKVERIDESKVTCQ